MTGSLVTKVLTVLSEVVATVLLTVAVERITRSAKPKPRFGACFRWVLISLIPAAAIVSAILLRARAADPAANRFGAFEVVAGCVLIQVAAIFLLVRWLPAVPRRGSPVRVLPGSQAVTFEHLPGGARILAVSRLETLARDRDAKAPLASPLMAMGVEILMGQIRGCSPRVAPDLVVGVNCGGSLLAAWLAEGLLGNAKIRLGHISTRTGTHGVESSSLPRLPVPNPTILLVDFEVKTGASIQHAVELLKREYGAGIQVLVAILVASRVSDVIHSIKDLCNRGQFRAPEEHLPHFLAFTTAGRTTLPV